MTRTAHLAPRQRTREQSRARYPDEQGFVVRDGVRIFYEVYGGGSTAIVLMPSAPIVQSRMWKAQIPYLSRFHRVITLDPRGNGRSDRPRSAGAYTDDEYVGDTVAVMDETGTEAAILVGLCPGVRWSVELASAHPARVLGIVALAPGMPFLAPALAPRAAAAETFDDVVDESAGWPAKENRHFWLRDYPRWVHVRSGEEFMLPESHSTKHVEDLVAWGLATDADTMLRFRGAPPGRLSPASLDDAEAQCRGLRCPVLIVHGTEDLCQPIECAERMAELTGGRLVVLVGAGHTLMARHPVKVNLLIKEFADSVVQPRGRVERWVTAGRREKRVLYLSSPIGLGHIMRDLAIADEIRTLHPGIRIDWLTQHPATRVLEARGEHAHEASRHLANESAHIESESADHDLHVFEAIRRMDEILVANFMVFHELLDAEAYDLVIGDEAWDVDHFWHENPELKRSAFCWMTDFVGWLPMPDGGAYEAFVAADYNAEMLEHVARHPRLRDRSIFVGNVEDIVPRSFGSGLPSIREWTERHYAFSGYVNGFDPASLDREKLRAMLGYRPDDKVCVVTVGGSGVGEPLLRKVIAAFPEARRLVPGLRMVVVAGPRIDPRSLPPRKGLEVHGHVDRLYERLAACDLAVVQGGLSTTMELTALRVPFVYFPIRHHFEQSIHVRHRLERYRAGRCMEYASVSASAIAHAIADEIGRDVDYMPVERDGAQRAARLIAELL